MRPASEKQKQIKNTKQEESTVSTDDNRPNDSSMRLIASEHLTIEMAVGYLFKWRKNSKIIPLLLERIQKFEMTKIVHYIPTIIFIMGLSPQDDFYRFSQQLANKSLPIYLIVRWSYTTYLPQGKKNGQIIKDKLDSSLLKKQKYEQLEEFNEESLKKCLKEKEAYSNYLAVMNEFYERLFKIPQKLKKSEKGKRNEKLRNYLNKIVDTFLKDQNGYLNGLAFPTQNLSCIAVRILTQFSFTFSTKQRVPFKMVLETISYDDAIKCRNGILPSNQGQTTNNKEKALILPQSYFGQQWEETEKKIRETSPYSYIPSYQIKSFMVKSGDDLRQEYMAMQLIKIVQDIAIKQNLKIWVRSYSVIPYNNDSGLIQFVPDTKTVSYLKQKSKQKSLRRIYQQIYGDQWQEATTNFIQSLAGYSLIQYLFQIKDRHNNNILVDTSGHIIHIDFSFMISSSPGNMGFERAPFKLTEDYMELMEGTESDIYNHFRMLFFLGLKFIRKYKKEIMQSILMMTHCSDLKCFQNFDQQKMERRFHEHATDEELSEIVDEIVADAHNSYTTSNYDRFQWYTNLIYS